MPLHSAIANARLKSSIAVDSSCWSSLSQGDFICNYAFSCTLLLSSFFFERVLFILLVSIV